MSERMRETRKLLITLSSWSAPITYHVPFSGSSAYGFTTRSRSVSRAIDRYAKRIVRCFEIAPSSLPRRPWSSGV